MDRNELCQIRLTSGEKSRFTAVANHKGLSLSSWARMTLLEAARRVELDGELVAGRFSPSHLADYDPGSEHDSLDDHVSALLNTTAEVDAQGCVWANGRWLTQPAIDRLVASIEEGL